MLVVFVIHRVVIQDRLEIQTLQKAKVLGQRKTTAINLSGNDGSKISRWCERSEAVRISF